MDRERGEKGERRGGEWKSERDSEGRKREREGEREGGERERREGGRIASRCTDICMTIFV